MAKKLEQYQNKRDFKKTLEPKGIVKKTSQAKQLKYVVQLHDASLLHYDFRLEWQGVLISFAIPKGPSFNPKDKRLAVHVEDHPIDYATFEGTIPKEEYGGGTVMLWDEGTWSSKQDINKALKKGMLKFEINGKRLKGKWALIRFKDDHKNWLLIKELDEYCKKSNGISAYKKSIVSGLTMSQIAKKKKK